MSPAGISIFSQSLQGSRQLKAIARTTLPLDVHIDRVDRDNLNIVLGLLNCASRIRSLYLAVTYQWLHVFKTMVQSPMTKPAPRLEKLFLTVQLDDKYNPLTQLPPVLNIEDFFRGNFSNLTELYITSQGRFDGRIPCTPNLRKLSVGMGNVCDQYMDGHSFGLCVAKFVKSLHGMPKLEELTLDRALSPLQEMHGDLTAVHPLMPASLKKLSLTGDTRACQPFLSRLIVPTGCTDICLDLDSYSHSDCNLNVTNLVGAMRTTFQVTIADLWKTAIHDAELGLTIVGSSDDDGHFGIYICPHPEREHCRRLPGSHCCKDALFRLDIAGGPHSDATPDLLTAVPFAMNVTTVNLIGNPGNCDSHGWPLLRGREQEERLLRNLRRDRFPALQRLVIAEGCLTALETVPEDLDYLQVDLVHV